MNNAELSTAWSDWIGSYRWDYFLTVTFREPRAPHHALSTVRQVGKVIRRATSGHYFLGTELHLNRTLHVHGLLQSHYGPTFSGLGNVTDQIWREFNEQFGRSEVRRVQKNEAVSAYVSKYVTKGFTEWDMRL